MKMKFENRLLYCLYIIMLIKIKSTMIIKREADLKGISHAQVIGLLIDNSTIKVTYITNYSIHNLTFANLENNASVARDLDFNIYDSTLLFTDALNKKIFSLNLDTGILIPVIQEGLEEPCAIAIDPSEKKFYFIDCKLNRMEMANLDGSDRKIINGSFKEPKDIALDHKNRLLFVSDAGSHTIEKFDINCAYKRTVIIENMTWPNGLTLDLHKERIFIIEAKKKKVVRFTYDGRNEKTIFEGDSQYLLHPFSINYHEKKLYIVDNGRQAIITMDESGKNVTVIATNLQMPTYFKIFSMNLEDHDETDVRWVKYVAVAAVVLIIIIAAIIMYVKRRKIVSQWERLKRCQYRRCPNNQPPLQ